MRLLVLIFIIGVLSNVTLLAQRMDEVSFAHGGAVNAKASDTLFEDGVTHSYPVENFDFLEGKWHVWSHSLRERMSESVEWLENTMETEFTVFLGGLVVINNTYGTFNGNDMDGLMIRAYDPSKDEWEFRWMSRAYPHLTEQVRGRFDQGIGLFYGTEQYDGHTFEMRFRWKQLSEDRAYWDQSYQDPETGAWQVNWILEYRRLPI